MGCVIYGSLALSKSPSLSLRENMQDKRRTDGSGSVSVWLARPHPYSPPWHRPSQRPHWTVPSDLHNCHGGVEWDEDDHADHADYADHTDHEGNDLNNSHGGKEGMSMIMTRLTVLIMRVKASTTATLGRRIMIMLILGMMTSTAALMRKKMVLLKP